ncbi:hypothetical protein STEG23_034079 [Scotinomys teguina]
MHRDPSPLDCKVYVGNLGNNRNKTELEWAFGYYGPLRSVWVAPNPPGFVLIESEDPQDTADAVQELDGRTLCGCLIRVELSNGEKRSRNRGPPPSWGRRPRDDYRRRSPPPQQRSPRRSFSRSRSRSLSRAVQHIAINLAVQRTPCISYIIVSGGQPVGLKSKRQLRLHFSSEVQGLLSVQRLFRSICYDFTNQQQFCLLVSEWHPRPDLLMLRRILLYCGGKSSVSDNDRSNGCYAQSIAFRTRKSSRTSVFDGGRKNPT